VSIALFMSCRCKRRLKLLSKTGDGESTLIGWLIHADSANRLITDYQDRGHVVKKFEEVLVKQRGLAMDVKYFNFADGLLCSWISIAAVGILISCSGYMVSTGVQTVGSIVATINVYKDLGDRFDGILNNVVRMTEVIDPLVGLTEQFNLPTDLPARMCLHEMREARMDEFVASNPQPATPAFDISPIVLKNVSIKHKPNLMSPMNLTTRQGTVTYITGPHDAGKASLVRLLTDNMIEGFADNQFSQISGEVIYPNHLRVLHVAYESVLVSGLGQLYGNLAFGKSDHEADNHERVKKILKRLRLNKHAQTLGDGASSAKKKGGFGKSSVVVPTDKGDDSEDDSEDVEEEAEEEEEEDEDESWQRQLSTSEKKRLCLARAFVYNPEVLVLHRPIDEAEDELAKEILGLIREFVDERGLYSTSPWHSRRPRTVFFTGGTNHTIPIADVVWRLGNKNGVEFDGIREEEGERPKYP